MKPVRLQRKRTKGSKLESPNGLPVVYVGRPSVWGNPFIVGKDGDAAECVRLYKEYVIPYNHKDGTLEDYYKSEAIIKIIKEKLRGKNLACFCKISQPCHADVLLDIANSDSDAPQEIANE